MSRDIIDCHDWGALPGGISLTEASDAAKYPKHGMGRQGGFVLASCRSPYMMVCTFSVE